MKKLNKKGITIVELIVSFVLVTVAVTYFYQTIDTVHDLYVTATKDTQEYVDKTYAMRIVDALTEKYYNEMKAGEDDPLVWQEKMLDLRATNSRLNTELSGIISVSASYLSNKYISSSQNDIITYEIKLSPEKTYSLYKTFNYSFLYN